MKRQLSNTIYGLKFAMEMNDFKWLKSSSGKKRNDFVANPIEKVKKKIFKFRVYQIEEVQKLISIKFDDFHNQKNQ